MFDLIKTRRSSRIRSQILFVFKKRILSCKYGFDAFIRLQNEIFSQWYGSVSMYDLNIKKYSITFENIDVGLRKEKSEY